MTSVQWCAGDHLEAHRTHTSDPWREAIENGTATMVQGFVKVSQPDGKGAYAWDDFIVKSFTSKANGRFVSLAKPKDAANVVAEIDIMSDQLREQRSQKDRFLFITPVPVATAPAKAKEIAEQEQEAREKASVPIIKHFIASKGVVDRKPQDTLDKPAMWFTAPFARGGQTNKVFVEVFAPFFPSSGSSGGGGSGGDASSSSPYQKSLEELAVALFEPAEVVRSLHYMYAAHKAAHAAAVATAAAALSSGAGGGGTAASRADLKLELKAREAAVARLKGLLTLPHQEKEGVCHGFAKLSPALIEAIEAHADYLDAFDALLEKPSSSNATANSAAAASGGGSGTPFGGFGAEDDEDDDAEGKDPLMRKSLKVLARAAEILFEVTRSGAQLGFGAAGSKLLASSSSSSSMPSSSLGQAAQCMKLLKNAMEHATDKGHLAKALRVAVDYGRTSGLAPALSTLETTAGAEAAVEADATGKDALNACVGVLSERVGAAGEKLEEAEDKVTRLIRRAWQRAR